MSFFRAQMRIEVQVDEVHSEASCGDDSRSTAKWDKRDRSGFRTMVAG